jgi:hemoglobin-like flavoprotein
LPAHYPIIRAALLDAMAAVGGDRWPPAYAAWAEAFAFVQEAMLRGAAAQARTEAAQAGMAAERA